MSIDKLVVLGLDAADLDVMRPLLARGLPKKESFFTVQRDAMDIDELESPALYFGTTTGQLWIGRDSGEEWSCLYDSLPPIHCVKVAVV